LSQSADSQYLAGYEQGKKDALAEFQQAPAGVVVVSKPAVPPKRATCGNCGAVCAYISKAVKEVTGLDLDSSGGCHWITCPSCGEDIVLKRW
jgi:ribosomal protein S27AE